MLGAFLLSLSLALLLGYPVLILLRKVRVFQPIRDDGPKRHMEKWGTPTMGGIVILFSFFISAFLLSEKISREIAFIMLSSSLCALVGLIDDINKLKVGDRGLRARNKFILQIGVAFLIVLLLFKLDLYDSRVWFPFISSVEFSTFYAIFVVFLFVASMNAVNITDGLDGLASGSSAIALFSLFLIALWRDEKDVAVLTLAIIGAVMGFLYYNRYPARMFMGDTGAMFLGGFIAGVSVILKVEMLMPFICGIFLIDTLSVIIQVVSYKTRRKRVFLMSPLHHHFELKGWDEPKVVRFFWGIEGLLSSLGLILYKIG